MKICEYIVSYLDRIGVKYIFGVGGANIEDIYDATYHLNKDLKAILAKHEFSAACMAEGYSRMKGELGVVIATSGGGCLNLVPGLAESFASKKPVLAIVGMPPTALEGLGAFQDASGRKGSLDGETLFKPLAGKYFHHVISPEKFQVHLYQAVTNALSKPYGTSILMIPKDIQQATLSPDSVYDFKKPDLLRLTSDSMQNASLPWLMDTKTSKLILVGRIVHDYQSMKLIENLAKATNAKIVVSPVAKHLCKPGNPLYLGITGVAGHTNVLEYAKICKGIVIIGTALPQMTRVGLEQYLDSQPILYINETEAHYDFSQNKQTCSAYLGDIERILEQLADKVTVGMKKSPNFKPADTTSYSYKVMSPDFFGKQSLFNFEVIFSLFNQYISDEDVCFADAGNTGGAAIHYLKPTHYFGIALSMGGMGYAIGASIGSCFQSNRRTYCFLGDGAFYMHGMEIHTAIEYNLPIRFIVFNNNAHAMCYTREKLFYQGLYTYNVFKPANLGAGCANMFPTLYSKDIGTPEALANTLSELEDYQGPVLLSLSVDYKEIPPFLPFSSKRRAYE